MKLLPLLDDFTPDVYEHHLLYDPSTQRRCALGHMLLKVGAPLAGGGLEHPLGLTADQSLKISITNDTVFYDDGYIIPISERIRRVKEVVAAIDEERDEA